MIFLDIYRVGSVKLYLACKSSEQNTKLRKVLYILYLRRNVISRLETREIGMQTVVIVDNENKYRRTLCILRQRTLAAHT